MLAQILQVLLGPFKHELLSIVLPMHKTDCKLGVAVDNEVLYIFVSTLADEYIEHFLAV